MKDTGIKKNQRIAILGTGPVSLLKALRLSKSDPGCRIILFDKAATPGGAWYSDQSPRGYEIECGCHIWSYVPDAYHFIEHEMGVKLYPVSPAPVFVSPRMRVPYSVKNTVDTYKTFFRMLVTLRWNKWRNLLQDPNMNFRIFGKRNRYPRLGSPELIHALLDRVSQQPNITLQLNTDILEYSINAGKAILKTENNLHEFDKLYLTYVTRIDQLLINNQLQEVKVRQVDYIHFLIRLDKPLLKKLTYWRLVNDPVIHRITDISGQTSFTENLVLIGIKDKAFHASDEETLLKHCQRIFEQYRLIDHTFEFEKLKTHIFPTHYLSDETLNLLKQNEPVVSLMHTTDLMHGIYFLLKGKIS